MSYWNLPLEVQFKLNVPQQQLQTALANATNLNLEGTWSYGHAALKTLPDLNQWVILFVYGLAIYNVIKILRTEINPPAATAWILMNLAFPFLGVPLYYFLGQSKLKSYVKRRRATRQLFSPVRAEGEFESFVTHQEPDGTDPGVPLPFYASRNEIKILDDGPRAFSEIFDSLSKAETYILVQYYIFRPDSLGHQFKDLLIERAKSGVKIFFIFDNIGSVGLTGKYIRDLKKNGIEVARFLPFQFRFHLQVNFRNHRKLVVIDGHTAFVGGMNVGNEYLGKKKFWRDTQLKIVGPAVSRLSETFLDDWNFAVSAKRRDLPEPLINDFVSEEQGQVTTRVISFGPGDSVEIGLYLFMHLIQSAQKSLIIATPYFIPDIVLERCLEFALQRGVDVTLIVPAIPDHWTVKAVSLTYVKRFAIAGGKVYLYKKGFMHQKVFLVDRQLAVIGTSNFDNRSIYLNFETCIMLENADLIEQVKVMLERDMRDSERFDPHQQDSGIYPILANFARLLAPLF